MPDTNPKDVLPAEVFHPMDYLMDELRARGWNLDDFAMRCAEWKSEKFGVHRLSLNLCALRRPDCRMGTMADDWARVLGTSAEVWRNLEANWLKHQARTGYVSISPELDEP